MAAAVAFAAILSMQPATAAADPVPAPAPDPGGAVAQARAGVQWLGCPLDVSIGIAERFAREVMPRFRRVEAAAA